MPSNQELQTLPFAEALDIYSPSLADALPDYIPLQRFKRVVVTAVNQNPELARADRRSLFNSCVKCALDGLYPDGQEAVLLAFGNQVQYLPMIKGIRKRLRNSGEVLSAIAEVVYRKDHFRYVKGEDPRVEHEPPALDQDRGDPIGAYAIIRLLNGESVREVMGLHEIERVRAFSRNARGGGSPWETSWGEMARKTVLRRCSKSAPTSADLDRLLGRDDEGPEPPGIPAPPRPRLADYQHPREPEQPHAEPDEQAKAAKTYTLVTDDGEFMDFDTTTDAANALGGMLAEVRPRGLSAIEAVWIDNAPLMKQLHADDPVAAQFIEDAYAQERAEFEPPAPDGPAQTPAVATLPHAAAGESIPERRPRGRPRINRDNERVPRAGETATQRPQETPTEEEEEVDRSQYDQAMLGPEPATDEHISDPIPHDDPDVFVPLDGGNIQEWFGRARMRLRDMQAAGSPPERFAAYRKANLGAIGRLKVELRSWHDQLDGIIAAGERGRG